MSKLALPYTCCRSFATALTRMVVLTQASKVGQTMIITWLYVVYLSSKATTL